MLTHAEFGALTTAEKIEYLKAAVEVQCVINEQIAHGLTRGGPKSDD